VFLPLSYESLFLSHSFVRRSSLAALAQNDAMSGFRKEIAHPDSESKSLDPGWPREVDRNGVRFVYYQPQVDEWKNLRELRARVAFTLMPKGEKPVVGIEELKGDTVANIEKRTVLINNIEIVAEDPAWQRGVRSPGLGSRHRRIERRGATGPGSRADLFDSAQ
jgi:hypothetical protein